MTSATRARLVDELVSIVSAAVAVELDDCIKAHNDLNYRSFVHNLTFGLSDTPIDIISHPMGANRMTINHALTEDLRRDYNA